MFKLTNTTASDNIFAEYDGLNNGLGSKHGIVTEN